MESIGALWVCKDRETGEVKKDRNGNSFFTGNLDIRGEKVKVIAFMNRPKTKDSQPDISINLSEPMGAKEELAAPQESFDDDIPF